MLRRLALLLALPACLPAAAQAGWSAPRTVAVDDSPFAVAYGETGTAALVAADDAKEQLVQTQLTAGVPSPLVSLAAIPTLSGTQGDLDGAGGAAYAAQTDAGVRLVLRDRDGTVPAPLELGAGSTAPVVRMNARGDTALAYTAGSRIMLVVRRRGEAPSAPVALSEPSEIDAMGEPGDLSASFAMPSALDVNERGDVLVAWERDKEGEARVRTADGALSPVAAAFNSITLYSPDIAVALDDDGRALAAVQSDDDTGPLVVKTLAPGAPAWSAADRLTTRALGGTVAAAAAGSQTILAWAAKTTSSSPATLRARSSAGGAALRGTAIPAVGAGSASPAAVALDVAADGSAVLAADVSGAIRAFARPPGATRFGAPRLLTSLAGGALDVAGAVLRRPVAAAPGGRALVAWNGLRTDIGLRELTPQTKETTPLASGKAPRLRVTSPRVDVRSGSRRFGATVSCDRACRVGVALVETGSFGSVVARADTTLTRGGRKAVSATLSSFAVRDVRRIGRAKLRLVATVSSSSGATSVRTVRPALRGL